MNTMTDQGTGQATETLTGKVASTAPTQGAPAIVAFGHGERATAGLGADDLGLKALNLANMAGAGLPVPPGFVLTTGFCRRYHADRGGEGRGLLDSASAAIGGQLQRLETATGRGFGSLRRPLLLSVRSGAAVSMPGMLETVLNVGLNRRDLGGLIRATGSPRFAWDCYRRLIQQYAEVVAGCPAEPFAGIVEAELNRAGLDDPRQLDFAALEAVAEAFLRCYRQLTGEEFPEDPRRQLSDAIEAVMRSWMSARARAFRQMAGLDDAGGTAVTVQAMVFGNDGPSSGSGVAFTRDPDTGEKKLFVDFCAGAQGEDVVSGRFAVIGAGDLASRLPAAWADLSAAAQRLEALFRDMQDCEFTIERGRLWLLQSRSGWRSPRAALRIAVDMVGEDLIDEAMAVERLAHLDPGALVGRRLAINHANAAPLARATVASAGCAVGAVAFDPPGIERLVAAGTPAILVRHELGTADIDALRLADGIVAAAGARTSHAAVVARGFGKVCLVGCGGLSIAPDARSCRFGDAAVSAGEFLSVDGEEGVVYRGRLAIAADEPPPELALLEEWRARAIERGPSSPPAIRPY